jgi:hypothetical protein
MESWVSVGGRQAHGQGDAASVDQQVVLASGLAAVCRVRAVRQPPFGAHADRVEAGAGPVELALAAELVQQLLVELLPHAGVLPVAQPPPAGDRAAAAELAGGQQPPGDAGAQLIDDAGQAGAVVDAWAAAVAGWRGGQQRLDGLP